jgi:hypothetical protein
LGGVGMVGGAWLGSGSACAQSINITASTIPGPTRQTRCHRSYRDLHAGQRREGGQHLPG